MKPINPRRRDEPPLNRPRPYPHRSSTPTLNKLSMAGQLPVPDHTDATGSLRMTLPDVQTSKARIPAPHVPFDQLPHDRQVDALAELARSPCRDGD